MEKTLKLSTKEIEELVLNLGEFEEAYRKYQTLCQNSLTVLWIIYFFLFAVLGLIFPTLENVLLVGMLLGVLGLVKLFPLFSRGCIKVYLSLINKTLGHQVLIYQKYHKIIKNSMIESLKEGSNNNYLQKVVIKTLSRSSF